MKSTPNLPASSRMKMPSGPVAPSIKGALKAKAFGMAGGVPSKGPIKGAGKGAKKKMMNK